MKVQVRLFAAVSEAVGMREVALELPPGTTASGLLDHLVREHPRLGALRPALLLAVNREYARGDHPLAEGDEVALIPPVSGGQDLYQIVEGPISLEALVSAVRQDSSGAVASFLGVVREQARGRRVAYLEYDAYPEMALSTLRQIGEEIHHRWPVDRVGVVHRVGRLEIGQASVAIAIASPHRREALEACAYAIERLKAIVPIWKKEVWEDGAEWIGSTVDEYREAQGKGQPAGGGRQEPPRPS